MNVIKKKKRKFDIDDILFYCVFMAWPVVQFCIYYVGVNINSILLSFRHVTETSVDNFSFAQYVAVFKWLGKPEFASLIGVSIKAFLVTHLIGLPLGLLFAYYIFKKLPCWSGFRVILFLPQILSSVVVAGMFRYFIEEAFSYMAPSIGNLLDPTKDLQFPVLMFYNIWIGFGTGVLMYSNKMSAIPEEIIESAHLDGATGLREFWYIVLPLTYSTISVFLITGMAGIFVNQFAAYDMYTWSASTQIKGIGYWFFVKVQAFKNMPYSEEIPYYSAIGVVLTFITIPIAFTTRWALEKYGPSED